MSARRVLRGLAVGALVTVGFGPPTVIAADAEPMRIVAANGRLTVHADGVPLPTVMAEITRALGSRISGPLERTEPVSIDFTDLEVRTALERLLGSQPFVTRYRGERIASIQLLDRGKGGVPVIVYPTPARAPRRDGPTIALSGSLATRIGAPRASLSRVAATAMGDEDASIRRQAAQALVTATNGDPVLRDELLATYGRMSEQSVAQFSGALPGATDFFEYLAAHSQSEELRSKASSILRALGPPTDRTVAEGREG